MPARPRGGRAGTVAHGARALRTSPARPRAERGRIGSRRRRHVGPIPSSRSPNGSNDVCDRLVRRSVRKVRSSTPTASGPDLLQTLSTAPRITRAAVCTPRNRGPERSTDHSGTMRTVRGCSGASAPHDPASSPGSTARFVGTDSFETCGDQVGNAKSVASDVREPVRWNISFPPENAVRSSTVAMPHAGLSRRTSLPERQYQLDFASVLGTNKARRRIDRSRYIALTW
jgi:hypothetical protein